MTECSPRAGVMRSAERRALPDRAFGLPSRRAYPMYRMVGGKAEPDAEHAANAKARAAQELERGSLNKRQYNQIVRKADKVLALCSGTSAKASRTLGALERCVSTEIAECHKAGCRPDEIETVLSKHLRRVRS